MKHYLLFVVAFGLSLLILEFTCLTGMEIRWLKLKYLYGRCSLI